MDDFSNCNFSTNYKPVGSYPSHTSDLSYEGRKRSRSREEPIEKVSQTVPRFLLESRRIGKELGKFPVADGSIGVCKINVERRGELAQFLATDAARI